MRKPREAESVKPHPCRSPAAVSRQPNVCKEPIPAWMGLILLAGLVGGLELAFLAYSDFFLPTANLHSGSHARQSSLTRPRVLELRWVLGRPPKAGRVWHRGLALARGWWESHQIEPFLVSILMASSRAKSLALLFKQSWFSHTGQPWRELLSCEQCVASLGRWRENDTSKSFQ